MVGQGGAPDDGHSEQMRNNSSEPPAGLERALTDSQMRAAARFLGMQIPAAGEGQAGLRQACRARESRKGGRGEARGDGGCCEE